MSAFDLEAVRALMAWRTPWLDSLAMLVSGAGFYGVVWMAVAAVRAVVVGRAEARRAVVRVVLAVLLANLVAVTLVKPLVDRDRPFVAHADVTVVGPTSSGSSFPSGHASIAAAGALAMTLMWPAGAAAWWLLAALTMGARVYMGVHYPSDVIGGMLLGLACGWLATGGTRPWNGRLADRPSW